MGSSSSAKDFLLLLYIQKEGKKKRGYISTDKIVYFHTTYQGKQALHAQECHQMPITQPPLNILLDPPRPSTGIPNFGVAVFQNGSKLCDNHLHGLVMEPGTIFRWESVGKKEGRWRKGETMRDLGDIIRV